MVSLISMPFNTAIRRLNFKIHLWGTFKQLFTKTIPGRRLKKLSVMLKQWNYIKRILQWRDWAQACNSPSPSHHHGNEAASRAEKALEVGFSSSLLHDIKLYCKGQVNCGGFNALLIRIEFSFTQEDARLVVGSFLALEELELLQKSFLYGVLHKVQRLLSAHAALDVSACGIMPRGRCARLYLCIYFEGKKHNWRVLFSCIMPLLKS